MSFQFLIIDTENSPVPELQGEPGEISKEKARIAAEKVFHYCVRELLQIDIN